LICLLCISVSCVAIVCYTVCVCVCVLCSRHYILLIALADSDKCHVDYFMIIFSAIKSFLMFFVNYFIVQLRLKQTSCHILYIGCLLYADDILLLSLTVSGL